MRLAHAAAVAPLLLVFLPISLPAQDVIAVGWTGGIYAVDSYTGTGTQIATGLAGHNALARDDLGRLWTGLTAGSGLAMIDPHAVPAATVVYPSFGVDLRGLANAGGGMLWGIRQATPDQLILIDTATGTWTTIGSTGYGSLQSLTNHNGVLYAWDLQQGLMTVDPVTGAATDVNPSIAGFDMQWLASRGDGQLIGGRSAIYTIDPLTGATTLVGGNVGDLRGADAWPSAVHAFGAGCNGVFGPVQLTASLVTTVAGSQLTLQSNHHQPGAIGLAVIGLSNTTFGSVPLPLLLDPIFGTSSCVLYTSPDVTVVGVTTATAPATLDFQFTFPPVPDVFTFFVQHAVLEAVPGGLSMSNGVVVQVGF
jgi:hypothetical protein